MDRNDGKDETVPFGKYKGRPIADMLADADYMAWLEAQPWFRERFAHLLASRDAEAASRTPVHNRLQALFLDPGYCGAFLEAARPARFVEILAVGDKARETAKETYDRFTKVQQDRLALNREKVERYNSSGNPRDWLHSRAEENITSSLASLEASANAYKEYLASWKPPHRSAGAVFEVEGCDVYLTWNLKWHELRLSEDRQGGREVEFEGGLRIEIKPTVGDEYPAVLRQMARNKSSYLFMDRYVGEGASEEQFVAIFRASGNRVIFKRDVDALVRTPRD